MQAMKIAAVQMRSVMADRAANLARISELAEQAADAGAAIVCFPELSITGSLYEAAYDMAEPVPGGPSTAALLPIAQRRHIVIIAGTCEMGTDGAVYNTLLLAFPDGRVGRFRKLYIPAGEYAFFRAGADAPVFTIPGCTFGVSICADLNFAELYKLLAVKGAEVVFNANGSGHGLKPGEAMPADAAQRYIATYPPRWRTAIQHIANTNAVYAVMCNQVGHSAHPTLRNKWFTGVTVVADPQGDICAAAQSATDDEMVVATLDPALFAKVRATGAFALHKRRRDILDELARLS